MKKRYTRLAVICISALTAASLTGCKDTDVLEQIIYKDNVPDVDKNVRKISNKDTEKTKKDEHLTPQKKDDKSKNKKKTAKDATVKGDKEDASKKNVALKADADAKQDAKGGAKSEKSENSDGKESSGKKADSGKKDKKNSKGKADGKSKKKDNGTRGSKDHGNSSSTDITVKPSDHAENNRDVVDANGNTVKVPENVDTAAAVGEAAVMVEMLGGKGRLVAASESLTDNSLAKQVFPDLKNVKTLWSGSGDAGISSGDFHRLINQEPDVCLVIDGDDTFSDKQLEKLEEYNIPVVTVYRLNTAENTQAAVTLIGRILGSKTTDGRKNAVDMAKSYNKWAQQKIDDVKSHRYTDYTLTDYNNDVIYTDSKVKRLNSRGKGQYSVFVRYWDDSAKVSIHSSKNYGKIDSYSGGAPATDSGYSTSPLSYYMSLGGVVNSPAAEAAMEDLKKQYTWYISPWLNTQTYIEISGDFDDYKSSDSSKGPYLTQVKKSAMSTSRSENYQLGSDDFKKVLVANKSVKAKLNASRLFKVYPKKKDGQYNFYGYITKNGLRMETSITGKFSVSVNPYGVSAWYDGSPEAVLEPEWIGYAFGTFSVSEGEVKNEIREFYEDFYDYSLSDGQLNKILDGSYAPEE